MSGKERDVFGLSVIFDEIVGGSKDLRSDVENSARTATLTIGTAATVTAASTIFKV